MTMNSPKSDGSPEQYQRGFGVATAPSRAQTQPVTTTKAGIADAVREQTGMPAVEAAEVVDLVLETMKSALEVGDTVQIQNFGKFVVRDKAPRSGRNPRMGEPIWIPARRVLLFKPSRKLNEVLSRAG